MVKGYIVRSIKREECLEWLLRKHYLRRVPPISWQFGLFCERVLCGVATIGKSPSSTLASGVCGAENSHYVQELNRLITNDSLPKNTLSFFVGRILRLLPPMILISYADESVGHHGYIYQATNWLYTGMSAKFKDPMVKGLEHQHHATFANGLSNSEVIQKYGKENVTFVERAAKHRYVMFIGTKKQKKAWSKCLNYTTQPYPKGDNERYDAGYLPSVQISMF